MWVSDLLDTEERWLASGTAASRAGAEADSLGFSSFDRDLSSVQQHRRVNAMCDHFPTTAQRYNMCDPGARNQS